MLFMLTNQIIHFCLEYPVLSLSLRFLFFFIIPISVACTNFISRYYIYDKSNILASTTSEGYKMKISVSVTIYAASTRIKHRIGRIKNSTIGRSSGQQRNQQLWALTTYSKRTKVNLGAEWTLPQVRPETPEFNWQW